MEIVLVLGYPASGKSTWLAQNLPGHERLNRDLAGRSLDALVPAAEAALAAGRSVALDNTYMTVESRRPLVELGQRVGAAVRCVWITTTIEQAQYNACERMVRAHGKLLAPDELRALGKRDPNTFAPAALFHYRKNFQEPTLAEGFAAIDRVPFRRGAQGAEYTRKALLLDYDGTLRTTKSGEKYPRSPDDIDILPGRAEALKKLRDEGWLLLGVSNQGDVSRGKLTLDDARRCFARTNELLGVDIEVSFCPHEPAPIACWCRKPMPGHGVAFVEKHKLDRAQTLMVGDMTSDKTFATRAEVGFTHWRW